MAKGVGVYVGRNEVVAVSAVHTAKGPQIKSFAIETISAKEPKGPSVDKEARELKKLSQETQAIYKALAKIKEPGAYVTAAVSPFQVATRHFMMPAVPKKEEANAVRFEASRYVPFKLAESVLDYSALSTHKNVISVTATAIRQEIVETCLTDLRAAGAKVLMIEPVYCAASRVFAALNMIDKEKAQGFIVLQADGNVNVTFASKGIVYLSRDFLLSGNLEEDKNRFYDETKASIDYFYKLTGGEGVGRIFLAGAGDLKIWVEHLEQKFNYEIRFDLANFSSDNNIPQETFNSVLIAFGLALRGMKYQSPLGDITLLPKDERRSPPAKLFTFLAIEGVALILLFLLIRLVAFQPYLMHLQAKAEAVVGPLEKQDPLFMSKPLSSLQSQERDLKFQVGQLNGFLNSREPASELLTAIGKDLKPAIFLNYISVEDVVEGKRKASSGKVKKRLNIRGLCYMGGYDKETKLVSDWVNSLNANKTISNLFGEVKLQGIEREKAKTVELTSFQVIGE